MSTLTVYQLPPSPNNVKIRLALGIKDIQAEFVNLAGFEDRSSVVEVSGQPLTPTIKHGDTVLFGSGAILRYLDANYRGQGPRLFSETQDGMRAIEEWEHYANKKVAEAVILVARQFFSGQDDPAATAQANELLAERIPKVEEALTANEFLTGDQPTAADCTLFPWVAYSAIDPDDVEDGTPGMVFASKLKLPAQFTKTREWLARMAKFDVLGPASKMKINP